MSQLEEERQIQLQFLDEAEDYLQTLEMGLLGLSSQPGDRSRMDALLRSAHSIKGGAAMMGFTGLSHLAHRLEDCLKSLRTSTHPIEADLERLLLTVVDSMRQVIEGDRQGVTLDPQGWTTTVESLFEQLHQRLGDPPAEAAANLLAETEGMDMRVLLFESEVEGCLQRLETVLTHPDQPCLREEFLIVAQELSSLGEMLELPAFTQFCSAIAQAVETADAETLPSLTAQILPQWRRVQSLVLIGQIAALPTQLDLTAPAPSPVAAVPDPVNDLETSPPSLEDLVTAAEFEAAAQDLLPLLDSLPVSPTPPPVPLTLPLAEPVLTAPTSETTESTIRVAVKQLDYLSDLFGELNIERNGLDLQLGRLRELIGRLGQKVRLLEQSNFRLRTAYDQVATPTAAAFLSPVAAGPYGGMDEALKGRREEVAIAPHQFDSLEMDRYDSLHLLSQEVMETIVQIQEVTSDIEINLEETEHTNRELHRTAKQMQTTFTQVRMRPFSDLVSRFPRALRDLALEYGKQVDFRVQGGSTLIDRMILEALNEPMLHLLRNAFDHGIEAPEIRRAAGKPEQGVISVSAAYRGNQTLITIRDDGGGIDLEKIRLRAQQLGFEAADLAQASAQELLDLIFEPGFSTADQVTELSGRGVGMDIVRTRLQEVRGDIHVDTRLGVGTTFTITVPFTLSVVRVLLVESEGMLLAFPTDAIEEMLLLQPDQLLRMAGQELLNWDNYMVPLIRLQQWLRFPRPPRLADTEAVPTINQPTVLLVTQGYQVVGLQVDRFWGEQEVTIRQVEGDIPLPPGFVGCTILGDGRIVPLVDPLSLLQRLEQQRQTQPIAAGAAHLGAIAGHAEPVPAPVPASKAMIMIVDDSINVRRFLALTLEKAGYRVEQAKDGQDALEKLQSGLPIQAVICDIEMPRLDGYGFLAHVKALPEGRDLPVAMLTSRTSEKHRQLAFHLGAAAYFSKPFQERDLLQTLQQLLQTVPTH